MSTLHEMSAAVSTQKRMQSWSHKIGQPSSHKRKGSHKSEAAVITLIMRRQPHRTRETAAVTAIKMRAQLSPLAYKIDRPQPFSLKIRQPSSKRKAVVRQKRRQPCAHKKRTAAIISKEKEVVRGQPLSTQNSQKRRSHEHHKREGSLGNTKESSPLSPPQTRKWIHDYRILHEVWWLLSFLLHSLCSESAAAAV